MDGENSIVTIAEHYGRLPLAKEMVGPLSAVIAWLAEDDRAHGGFDGIVQRHGLRHEGWFRKQIADLVIDYIAAVRSPRPISEDQLFEIQFLKDALRVREGELLRNRPAEIAAFLNEEVEVALADGIMTEG